VPRQLSDSFFVPSRQSGILADTARRLSSLSLLLWASTVQPSGPVRRVRLEPNGCAIHGVTILRVLLLALEHGKSLYHGMKLLTLLALSLLVALPPLAVASPHDTAIHITRNEAQHLALQDHPGGRVTAANLDHSRGRPVWQIEIAEPNANALLHLSVDATSGRIVSGAKASR
jgi:Peptidase propeptide and YPEB domain